MMKNEFTDRIALSQICAIFGALLSFGSLFLPSIMLSNSLLRMYIIMVILGISGIGLIVTLFLILRDRNK